LGLLESCSLHILTCIGLHDLLVRCSVNFTRKSSFRWSIPAYTINSKNHMQERTCYIKGVSTIRLDIKSMPTLKVNSWLGVSKSTVNSSPMLKPCSSSSKHLMVISVAFHCSHPALDHTSRKHNNAL
jgi:hypothetical protein